MLSFYQNKAYCVLANSL